jgi:outer membrane protein TolC
MPMVFVCLSVSAADRYWDHIVSAAVKHPSFETHQSKITSAGSLIEIERARRFPKVEGVFARLDGSSTLITTPDAWQTGLALTYPLYDNNRQDARDVIAKHQGSSEGATSAQNIERFIIDLANAHIRIWESTESIQILRQSEQHLAEIKKRITEQAESGEASLLLISRFTKMMLDTRAKLLEAEQRLNSAKEMWSFAEPIHEAQLLLPEIQLADTSITSHAGIKRLEAELSRAEGEYSLARRDEGVSVNFQISSLLRKYSTIPDWSQHQIWQVTASYPIFDGGLSKSRTQRESLTMQTKRAELDAEKALVQTEYRRLTGMMASLDTIIFSMHEQCQLQSQIANNMLKRLQLGRGSVLEVTESYLSSQECALSLIRNRADYFFKYHELSRLNGTLAALINNSYR